MLLFTSLFPRPPSAAEPEPEEPADLTWRLSFSHASIAHRTSDDAHVHSEGFTRVDTPGFQGSERNAPTTFRLHRGMGRRYWELELVAGSTAADFNGYVGVMPYPTAKVEPMTVNPPLVAGSIAARGNGDLWSGGEQQSVDSPAWRRDDIVMLCFDTDTRQFWIGKNGTWNANPDTQSPTFTGPDEGAFTYDLIIQPRDNNSGWRIFSQPEDFTYSVPSSAVPLATNDAETPRVRVERQHAFLVVKDS